MTIAPLQKNRNANTDRCKGQKKSKKVGKRSKMFKYKFWRVSHQWLSFYIKNTKKHLNYTNVSLRAEVKKIIKTKTTSVNKRLSELFEDEDLKVSSHTLRKIYFREAFTNQGIETARQACSNLRTAHARSWITTNYRLLLMPRTTYTSVIFYQSLFVSVCCWFLSTFYFCSSCTTKYTMLNNCKSYVLLCIGIGISVTARSEKNRLVE